MFKKVKKIKPSLPISVHALGTLKFILTIFLLFSIYPGAFFFLFFLRIFNFFPVLIALTLRVIKNAKFRFSSQNWKKIFQIFSFFCHCCTRHSACCYFLPNYHRWIEYYFGCLFILIEMLHCKRVFLFAEASINL